MGRALELILYLAHQASRQRGEAPYTTRYAIGAALWPEEASRNRQLANLSVVLSRLNDTLSAEEPPIPALSWLQRRERDGSLRLDPQVQTDLAELMKVARRCEQVYRRAVGSHQEPAAEEISQMQADVTSLERLYQDGFALQFEGAEWVERARQHYQRVYLDALAYAARVLAQGPARRQAIELAKQLVLEDEEKADELLRHLFAWLAQEGPLAVTAWAEELPRRYERKYERRLERASFAQARPDLEAIRLRALENR